MSTNPNDFMTHAWTQQMDISRRAIEALVEGAARLRELQLEAAADARAGLEAMRDAAMGSQDPARVLELQAQWVRANAEKTAAYWRRFWELSAQTQASLAQCNLNEGVYRQWLDAAQQLYKAWGIPAQRDGEAPATTSAQKDRPRPKHHS